MPWWYRKHPSWRPNLERERGEEEKEIRRPTGKFCTWEFPTQCSSKIGVSIRKRFNNEQRWKREGWTRGTAVGDSLVSFIKTSTA